MRSSSTPAFQKKTPKTPPHEIKLALGLLSSNCRIARPAPWSVFKINATTRISELQNCRPGTTNRICSYCPDLLDGLKSKVVSPGIGTLAGNSAITNCDSKRRCKAREAKALTALTVPPFSLDEGDVFQTTVCRGSWDYDVTAAQLPINAAASMREASTPDSTVDHAVSRLVSNHQRGRAILPVAIAILQPTMALSLPRQVSWKGQGLEYTLPRKLHLL